MASSKVWSFFSAFTYNSYNIVNERSLFESSIWYSFLLVLLPIFFFLWGELHFRKMTELWQSCLINLTIQVFHDLQVKGRFEVTDVLFVYINLAEVKGTVILIYINLAEVKETVILIYTNLAEVKRTVIMIYKNLAEVKGL